MLEDNIKRYRKEKHMSQEELAIQCHVVRQTVSKWEKGLSVPDADSLISLANVLQVSVGQLLGYDQENVKNLSEELQQLNQELAKRNQIEKLNQKREQKRNSILFLIFLALISALIFHGQTIGMIFVFVFIGLALLILYRNMVLLSSTHKIPSHSQIKALQTTTLFSVGILVVCVILSVLFQYKFIEENVEDIVVVGIVSVVILFGGYISPKLPFTRHTGLRLPWTIADEETWNVAHRIIGVISVPIVLVYLIVLVMSHNIEMSTLIAILSWVLIPGILSFLFYIKKYR